MRAAEKNKIKGKARRGLEDGFSLIEMIFAIMIMTVMMLGTLSVFTYAVHYNRGNNLRSQALTVLQQEAEIYRSTKFTPAVTDSALLGGAKSAKTATSADGTVFMVNITVDNDPSTAGIQTSETLSSGKPCTLKEIKITVSPRNTEAAWMTAIVTDVTIQRVRSN
jgi:prepilin-type N-terminal cleavage/methylation domain-containing protein